MIQLRYHDPSTDPPMAEIVLLAPLLPVIDIRAGSRHPLAWKGTPNYRNELRATWRANSGRFALPDDALVLGCPETLPTFAAVFRALGREVDEGAGVG